MGSGEAKARSEELARGLRKEFGLDQVEAEFAVLVGRNGGLFLTDQVDTWRRSRELPDTGTNARRWIGSLGDKLGSASLKKFSLEREGTRRVEVRQFVGRRLYRELGMENSRSRLLAHGTSTIVEVKRRLVSVGAVLARWWYPWLGSVEASVSWCDALGIDRAVLPNRYGKGGKKKPSYFPDRSPHAAEGNRCLFVYPLVVEQRDESRGLRKWGESYAPLWQALGRVGVETTVVVARSAETLWVPVADVTSDWEVSAESHRAVRGIWLDSQLDYVLAGNPPAALEAHGGAEGVARRRRELAVAIEEARSAVGRGVAKTEELVLEEVPA